MPIKSEIKALQKIMETSSFRRRGVKELTEAELELLCYTDMLRLLRDNADVRLISEDPSPTLAQAFAAAGVAPVVAAAGESAAETAKKISDEQLRVYVAWTAGCEARYAARRAARRAARAGNKEKSDPC